MTFFNVTLRCHENSDHWVFYHLRDVHYMCLSSLNHFPNIYAVPFRIGINVNFTRDIDKCLGDCSCGKMSG